MAKKNKSENPETQTEVTIFIEDELDLTNKQRVGSLLKLPFTENRTNKALRIFDAEGNQVHYCSVRLGDLKTTDEGYQCDVTGREKELIGCSYELREVGTKALVLSGKIAVNEASASVISISQASNG